MSDCPRCAQLAGELADTRAALNLERSRRTTGGAPMRVTDTWDNTRIDSPSPGAEGAR